MTIPIVAVVGFHRAAHFITVARALHVVDIANPRAVAIALFDPRGAGIRSLVLTVDAASITRVAVRFRRRANDGCKHADDGDTGDHIACAHTTIVVTATVIAMVIIPIAIIVATARKTLRHCRRR